MSKNSRRYCAVLLGTLAVALVGAPGGRGEARTHVEGRPGSETLLLRPVPGTDQP